VLAAATVVSYSRPGLQRLRARGGAWKRMGPRIASICIMAAECRLGGGRLDGLTTRGEAKRRGGANGIRRIRFSVVYSCRSFPLQPQITPKHALTFRKPMLKAAWHGQGPSPQPQNFFPHTTSYFVDVVYEASAHLRHGCQAPCVLNHFATLARSLQRSSHRGIIPRLHLGL
jgi:hypothetical protein